MVHGEAQCFFSLSSLREEESSNLSIPSEVSWPGSVDHEVLDKKLHHTIAVDRPVAQIGTDLHIEAFSSALQGADELHHVRGMNIVVGRSIVKHQTPFQFVSIIHQ